MKISSLLLSSAAVLASGSVFAADLPAKKAAPAAAAQSTGCPAFGPGYFAIPGGDTCLKVSGYVRSDSRYINATAPGYSNRPGTANYTTGYKYVLGFDTMSNSEIGQIHARIGMYDAQLPTKVSGTSQDSSLHTMGSPATESAYIDIGTFRAGYAPSTVDFDNAYNLSGLQYQPTAVPLLAYTIQAGSTAFTLAAENTYFVESNALTTNTGGVASRPDMIGAIKTTMGDTVIKAGLVSHEIAAASATQQGYAALGRLDQKFGDATLILGAAWAKGAIGYLDNPTTYGSNGLATKANQAMGGIADSDSSGNNLSQAQMVTAAIEYKVAGKDTVYAYAGTESGTGENISAAIINYNKSIYGVGYKYMIGKTLYIRPEFYGYTEDKGDGAGSNNYAAGYLRIRKDF